MECPKCGNHRVQIYYAKDVKRGVHRKRRCANCQYEFSTYEFLENDFAEILRKKKSNSSNSICWKCKKATGGYDCSWANEFLPVQGWDAEKTELKNYNGIIESYEVFKCPLFLEDERW